MSANLEWLAKAFPYLADICPLKDGGQKLVFRCEHAEYGPCVLKLVKPWAADRLDREIEAVRRLMKFKSDNVPRIYGTDTVSSQIGSLISILEQRISGVDLADVLRDRNFGKQQVLRLAFDLLSAVSDAESVNVVHRDIKPANIKIDSHGAAWLLDFGIARILDLESRTRTDALVGPHSPGYSAPEQFRYQKHDIDSRADLFAIGVVLFESAMGTNPFLEGAANSEEVLRRVEKDPLPRLELIWDFDSLFADFVSALTQKHIHQRPHSCAEASDWLQDIVDHLGGL